jgi:hypothetical protein
MLLPIAFGPATLYRVPDLGREISYLRSDSGPSPQPNLHDAERRQSEGAFANDIALFTTASQARQRSTVPARICPADTRYKRFTYLPDMIRSLTEICVICVICGS